MMEVEDDNHGDTHSFVTSSAGSELVAVAEVITWSTPQKCGGTANAGGD